MLDTGDVYYIIYGHYMKYPQLWVTIATDLPLDMFPSSTSLLQYPGYVPLNCPNSCDWYGSYEDAGICDRLLAIVGRVMTSTQGNLQGCVQRCLYPVLGFEWTVGRNKFTVIYLNKQMLVTTQSYVL